MKRLPLTNFHYPDIFAIGMVIVAAVLLRIVPHPPNVAPVAAIALFGGLYISKRFALIVPLIIMFLSDAVLGFHSGMPFVYGSFLLIGLLGVLLQQKKGFLTIILASIGSSILFYLITNFGVWHLGTMYPHTLEGLLTCYIAGLPFLRNTFVGDLLYTALLCGGYELIIASLKQKGLLYGR